MTALNHIYNKNHLSKRPFLIVNATFKPPQGAHTSTKGWADTAGWDRHESISLVDRIKPQHLTNSSVIIDILEVKVIKNSFEHTPAEVIKYFLEKYKPQIKEALKIWANKEALKLAKVDAFSAEQVQTQQAEFAALEVDPASGGDGESPDGAKTA